MAVFQLPVVLKYSALKPMAVLEMPVLFKSASSPRTVLLFVKQPSWQTARACDESAKQASGMSRNASRRCDRFTEIFDCRVGVFIIRRGLQKSGRFVERDFR